jgi:hypothetical protein
MTKKKKRILGCLRVPRLNTTGLCGTLSPNIGTDCCKIRQDVRVKTGCVWPRIGSSGSVPLWAR